MFRHLVIPCDLTDKNRAALDAARELLAGREGSVVLVHVVETIEHVPFAELEGFYAELKDRAAEVLEGWRAELAEAGIDATWEVVFGRRAEQIVARAGRPDVDLVVLSTHTVDLEQPRPTLGTLSHRVALLAPCPVLMVR